MGQGRGTPCGSGMLWRSGAGPSCAHGDAQEHPRPPAESHCFGKNKRVTSSVGSLPVPLHTRPIHELLPAELPCARAGLGAAVGQGAAPRLSPPRDLSPSITVPRGFDRTQPVPGT